MTVEDHRYPITDATDANGTAGALVGAGGYVTAIEPGAGAARLTTFAGVQPSDALHLDLDASGDPGASGATGTALFTLTVPLQTGAAGYTVYTSCGPVQLGAAGAGIVSLDGCGGIADLIVVASDDTDAVLGTLYQPGVAIDGQAVAITGSYQALVPNAFAYKAIPAAITYIATYDAILTDHGRLFGASIGTTVSATATVDDSLMVPGTTGTTSLTVSDGYPNSTELGEQLIYDWQPTPGGLALDFSAAPVLLKAYASPPVYAAAARTVTWTESSAGVQPDAVRTSISVYRDAIPSGSAWSWRMISPRAIAASVAYPHLPAGGFDFNPGPGDSVGVDDLTSLQLPGGYDALRALGFSNVTRFVAGASGRIVVELPFTPNL